MHTVIDDKLFLSIPNYDESRTEKDNWGEIMNRHDAELEYQEAFQTGSRSLYFAQCNDENETWLPLLEKAYAKAHGDYYSIIGGFTGEAIEDLTGGVTTELFATDILDKDRFWEDELQHVGSQFLFGCATGRFDDWQGGDTNPWRQGIVSSHAYTILRASEYKGERLLLVRNPWGEAEWSGRWSDGSEQWTPESMQRLNHRFGDDGMFWISYEDLLRKYQYFDRTRLFDSSWKVSQQWTAVDVGWTADYNDTKFTMTLTEATPVVIVLSQLDDRYWCGLEGQYSFTLHFRVDKDGEHGYEVRSHGNYWMSRSVSTEVDLEPGAYSVFIKLKAERDLKAPRVEDVVRRNCKTNQEKLMQVGLAYDLAHAKGAVLETEESKKAKAEADARQKAKAKQAAIEEARELKYRRWQVHRRNIERDRREKARLEAHRQKKAAQEATAKPPTEAEASNGVLPDGQDGAALQPDGQNAPGVLSPPASPDHRQDDGTQTPASQAASADGASQPATAAPQVALARSAPVLNGGLIEQPTVNVAPLPARGVDGLPAGGADSDNEDAQTVVSFADSVDSLLDLQSKGSDIGDSDVEGDEAPDSDNEEFAADPWNAVCVVGLRVYSKHGDASVAVVRPKTQVDGETPLDVDDPSKGLSEELSPLREKGAPAVKALEEATGGGVEM